MFRTKEQEQVQESSNQVSCFTRPSFIGPSSANSNGEVNGSGDVVGEEEERWRES